MEYFTWRKKKDSSFRRMPESVYSMKGMERQNKLSNEANTSSTENQQTLKTNRRGKEMLMTQQDNNKKP